MGFEDKSLVFGGAQAGTPWGTLGEITGRALAPLGYSVRVEAEASRDRNPRLLAAGKVDLGATNSLAAFWAYEGSHTFAGEEPRRNLRVIATIMFPAWIGLAVRWETGITDLSQVRERRLPLRILGGTGAIQERILAHYGLSHEDILSWGGRIYRLPLRVAGAPWSAGPWVRAGDFDCILDVIFSGYLPEVWHWQEAAILHNLRFLPLPDDLIAAICRDFGGEPGAIPHHLYRGLEEDTPSVYRPWQVIYARDDMPEEFAYTLARNLDEKRDLFRKVHCAFSYEPRTVAMDHGLPLHPGAARYYREAGYLT